MLRSPNRSESTATVDDVIHQRRSSAVAHAGQIGTITHAADVFGTSRQTLSGRIGLAAQHGLDALLPKDRRPSHQPTAMAPGEIETIIAEAVARPALGAQQLLDPSPNVTCTGPSPARGTS